MCHGEECHSAGYNVIVICKTCKIVMSSPYTGNGQYLTTKSKTKNINFMFQNVGLIEKCMITKKYAWMKTDI